MRRHGPSFARIAPGLIASLILTVTPPSTSSAQQPFTLPEACVELAVLSQSNPDSRIGVVIEDLASGERCDLNAGDEFRMASLYKLIVLTAAYQQIADGALALTDEVLIEPHHAIDDPPALRLTESIVRDAATAIDRMIHFSANPEAVALYERLGPATVDALPSELGMESTRLGSEYVSSPDDIATYFRLLYDGELVDREASRAMHSTLLGQEINDLIPLALPPDTTVAHKTGLLPRNLNDAGIVYAPGGAYILSILVEHSGSIDDAAVLIRSIAALSYGPFALVPIVPPPPDPSMFAAEEAPPIARAVLAGLLAPPPPAATTLGADAALSQPGPTSLPSGSDRPPGAPPVETVATGPPAEPAAGRTTGRSPLGLPELPPFTVTDVTIALGMLSLFLVGSGYAMSLRRRRIALYHSSNLIARERRNEMRLGIRKAGDGTAAPPPQPTTRASVIEDGPGGEDDAPGLSSSEVVASPSLERLDDLFSTQLQLLEAARRAYEDEVRPIEQLLQQQRWIEQQLLASLETRLSPLIDFASAEESNLDRLETSLSDPGGEFIHQSFIDYFLAQRQHIADTRALIDDQRRPLVHYGAEQRESVEVALARFDQDAEALDLNLAEQRRLLTRLIEGLRSDTFVSARKFLQARANATGELAAQGVTDPREIAKSARPHRELIVPVAGQSAHVQQLVEATDQADEDLLTARLATEPAPADHPAPRELGTPDPNPAAPPETASMTADERLAADRAATGHGNQA